MSSLHRRILDGFTHTQYWADLGPKSRQRIIDVVSQGRNLLPPQGVRWLSRVLNRGMTMLSIDPPDDESKPNAKMVRLPVTKRGSDTYAASFEGIEAGPRDLWLEMNSSFFIDVGAPISPGIYELHISEQGTGSPLKAGSVVNFNDKTITLVSSRDVTVLKTLRSGGRVFNKWRNRRNRILQHYPQDRVLADFNFFASKDNRGQMMEVLKNLREAAARNKILSRALDTLTFTKAGTGGLDMPATAFGGAAGPGNCVYDTLNDLMKLVSELEQLPQGTPIVQLDGNRKWVMLDTHGSKVEASFMRHCLAGETEVITDKGLVQIKDLAGTTAVVLTMDPTAMVGAWSTAKFNSYGTQLLKAISLAIGQVEEHVFATGQHRWPVIGVDGKMREVITDDLRIGDKIPVVMPGEKSNCSWVVTGVESTSLVEEVFCAEVPVTQLFTLKGNIASFNCGNSGGVSGDRLMSFRVPSKSIEGLHEPKLTFIYRPSDRSVGEMKGFANNKPDSSYHDAIVQLFSKADLIDIIHGNGYMPQNNFSLNDLSDKNLERIYQANPKLVINMLDHGDNFQRLNSNSIKALEKLLGHPIKPEASEKKPAKAKKTKKITDEA